MTRAGAVVYSHDHFSIFYSQNTNLDPQKILCQKSPKTT